MKAAIEQVDTGLYLVALPVAIHGFEGFITSWVHTGGPVLVVDVGPSATSDALLDALAVLGVHRPDYILLTHIHIDHGGAIGEVARAFPRTPVVCHPKAIPHLVDPTRLWEGSRQTLGPLADRYGPIAPVPAGRVIAADALDLPGLTAVATPGHAAHQYSYLLGDLLFAGEAGGVCLALEGGGDYMRPATPPPFRLETCLESVDRLLSLRPQRICYGHIGMRHDAVARLTAHGEQLRRWRQLIAVGCDAERPGDAAAVDRCVDYLLAHDPLLAGLERMPAIVRERERFFLSNSVRGYWSA